MPKKQTPAALVEQSSLQQLLKIPRVAELLGVSRDTVYKLISTEGLPIVRVGGSIRVSPPSLQAWIKQREQAS